jgi:hypothetical protein
LIDSKSALLRAGIPWPTDAKADIGLVDCQPAQSQATKDTVVLEFSGGYVEVVHPFSDFPCEQRFSQQHLTRGRIRGLTPNLALKPPIRQSNY